MFDFKKLSVYQKSKALYRDFQRLISNASFNRTINDQLRRASISIVLNIAEGSSRFSNKDRRRFMVIARGSAFECSAILDILVEDNCISIAEFQKLNNQLEIISKMLFGLIRKLEK